MMELSLIRTLHDQEFYEDHKGIKCPDKLFTKDVRKIKRVLDNAMDKYAAIFNVGFVHLIMKGMELNDRQPTPSMSL